MIESEVMGALRSDKCKRRHEKLLANNVARLALACCKLCYTHGTAWVHSL